jgi:hypothetical protein
LLGIITGKEVCMSFGLIWREFGPRCAVRSLGAVLRRKPTTFLDLVFETDGRRVPLTEEVSPTELPPV